MNARAVFCAILPVMVLGMPAVSGGQSDILLAPPAKRVNGLTAVPIDIQQLDAQVVLDAASKRAKADASICFLMGSTDGNPIFDLRQEIEQAFLNGQSISPDKMRHHDFGAPAETLSGLAPSDIPRFQELCVFVAALRVLETTVSANSENTLHFVYEIGESLTRPVDAIAWDAESSRLYWDLALSDWWPSHYMEKWFPSNLIYDRFKSTLAIVVTNSDVEHALITNGRVASVGLNHWRVEFPARFTSLSPMLVIAATDTVDCRKASMTLPDNGQQLDMEIFKLANTPAELAAVEGDIKKYIAMNVTTIGPYIHGGRFVAFIHPPGRSMEFEGGVNTGLDELEHELLHNWFGRGIKPASKNDDWIDEALAVYYTGPDRFAVKPFDMTEPPAVLSQSNPYNRAGCGAAYTAGPRFLAGLAAAIGLENLRSHLSSFYKENAAGLITTRQFQEYLIIKSGNAQLAGYFRRFVYGVGTPGADLPRDH